ncbi:heavy metal-associated isoprenylated plant protein 41-like [Iris pallida]|uniref:Heavy metal-associated isoprenylated plant protein 41-like n=1 Tax=Iris pallida TaxID=29817 RepID=A0AAX6E801_IRIPA|nr:heavy metal-associated isoprenylated plant protein 41-like [Iris pallida]KAJ6824584.1 heavy metal-associated isoprenylated plant protein 41-like [Iris pallida]
MKKEGEEEVKWVKHYSSAHQILLVGEGDFSFSLSLANAFGSASNMVTTSLDSYDTLLEKYNEAKSNLESLKKMGATVLHEVNAKKLTSHQELEMRKFDRIVFNFPHAGFIGSEDNWMVIDVHKELVSDFLKNSIHMLRSHGEVHISHKIGYPYDQWNLEEIASNNSLVLIERARFIIEDYPGYSNKRGDGSRCDEPFPLGECCTYRFRVEGTRKRKRSLEVKPAPTWGSYFTENVKTNFGNFPYVGFRHECMVWGIPPVLDCTPRISSSNIYCKETDARFFSACQANQSTGLDLARSLENSGYQAFVDDLSGDIRYFEKQCNQSVSRRKWLQSLIWRFGRGDQNS